MKSGNLWFNEDGRLRGFWHFLLAAVCSIGVLVGFILFAWLIDTYPLAFFLLVVTTVIMLTFTWLGKIIADKIKWKLERWYRFRG